MNERQASFLSPLLPPTAPTDELPQNTPCGVPLQPAPAVCKSETNTGSIPDVSTTLGVEEWGARKRLRHAMMLLRMRAGRFSSLACAKELLRMPPFWAIKIARHFKDTGD